VLYHFCSRSKCSDGFSPLGGVVIDGAGNLYGTTSGGGRHNFGSLFELMPDNNESKWTQMTLYNFCSETKCSDGNYPWTPPLIDNESNLYGTTAGGGTRRIPGGGVVYTLTP
jgi:uncharacterized repeat protein (TIGR03803 family)